MKLMPYLSLTSLLLLLPPSVVLSQEDLSGRLPDGRAFRTDSEGNQIVDYIAELEMTVAGLKRRVQGLEDELESRPAANRGKQALEERDLLKDADPGDVDDEGHSFGTLESVNVRSTDDNRAALEQCETNLSRQKENASRLSSERTTCQDELRTLKTEVRGLELKAQQASLVQQNAEEQQRNFQNLAFELHQARQRADLLENEVAQLNEQLQAAEAKSLAFEVDFQNRLAAFESENRELTTKVSQLEKEAADNQKNVVRARYDTDPLAVSRSKAVQSLRAPMLADISEIRKAAQTRDKAFKSYKRSDVQFAPQRLVSRRGLTLSRIEQGVRTAESVEQLAQYRRDIREVASKVKQDLQMIKRIKQL